STTLSLHDALPISDGAALVRALHGEVDHAVHQGEQGVVTAQADALAGMELGAALADDDVAGLDGLAAVDLHTQVLRVGIAAVAGRAYAFFLCHDVVSSAQPAMPVISISV